MITHDLELIACACDRALHMDGGRVVGRARVRQNNNHDKKRPKNIKVRLFADGKDTGKVLTLSVINNWKGSFTELPKYTKDRKLIKYTIRENQIGRAHV